RSSRALRPQRSPSRVVRPSTSEAPAALLPPPPLQLLPGGAIQFPGGSFFPAVDQRLFTAHRKIAINETAVCFQTVGSRSATPWQAPSFARQPAERELQGHRRYPRDLKA